VGALGGVELGAVESVMSDGGVQLGVDAQPATAAPAINTAETVLIQTIAFHPLATGGYRGPKRGGLKALATLDRWQP